MWLNSVEFRTRWLFRTAFTVTVTLYLMSAHSSSCRADELPVFTRTTGLETSIERSVWTSIVAGRDIDLGCDSGVSRPAAVTNKCKLRGQFLAQILSQPKLAKQIPARGIMINGALIDGDLDFSRLAVDTRFVLVGSTIRGALRLDGATMQKEISFARTRLEGVTADALVAKANVIFRNAVIAGDAAFPTATFAGQLSFSGASIQGRLDCSACVIDKGLFLEGTSISGSVSLPYSKIRSALNLSNSTFGSYLDISNSDVDTTVYFDNGSISSAFLLQNAHVSGNLSLTSTKFGGTWSFFSVNVGGFLDAQNAIVSGSVDAQNAHIEEVRLDSNVFSGDVDFGRAKITGFFATSQRWGEGPDWATRFNNGLRLDGIEIGGGLSLTNAAFSDVELLNADINGTVLLRGLFPKPVQAEGLHAKGLTASGTFSSDFNCVLCRIDGNVTLFNGQFSRVDLRAGSVAGTLALGDGPNPLKWADPNSQFDLRDATITTLSALQESFPEGLELAGLSYKRLTGFCRLPEADDRRASSKCLSGLLRRSNQLDISTYTRMVGYLRESGNNAVANDLLFASRNRVIEQAAANGDRGEWFRLSALRATIGFGIGDYAFRIFGWIVALTLIATAVLYISVAEARKEGILWCIGASLNRLLPVVELNKEFADFFDDPGRLRLNNYQAVFFGLISGLGWMLGLFAVAAVSGLTEK